MMPGNDIAELSAAWIKVKDAEAKIVADRRKIEDELIAFLRIKATEEGTKTVKREGFIIKVTNRFTRKVDSDKLQSLALDAGIGNEVLQGLFRWKPELALTAWKDAAPSITSALAGAITTTASRSSVSIELLIH
ncbi:MAG: hypothetical protein EBS41_00505 [Actinobacteria bacterium]|jgi:hypothetical protein|nr:hypothetical protein [Actinomycetota bacterium]